MTFEIFFSVLGALVLLAAAGGLFALGAEVSKPWRERRALARLARSYGIEYVPGEDPKALRAKVIQKRDAGLRCLVGLVECLRVGSWAGLTFPAKLSGKEAA